MDANNFPVGFLTAISAFILLVTSVTDRKIYLEEN